MADPAALRETALERTFGVYVRRWVLWLALLVPVAATAGLVFLAVRAALTAAGAGEATEAARRAVAVMPGLAAVIWLIGGGVGAQVLALRTLAAGREPDVHATLLTVLPRLPRLLAVTAVVVVLVAAAGLAGAGAAAALAWVPRAALPALGASEATAKSLSLLVLLPLLVAGALPALWIFGRHVLAIPLAALRDEPPFASIAAGRRISRGHAGTVLGLFIVTALAGNVAVLLSRAAGSLVTLLVARDYYRPIFGAGPLDSSAGAWVQLGTTAAASLVMLPLLLLPCAILAVELERSADADAD